MPLPINTMVGDEDVVDGSTSTDVSILLLPTTSLSFVLSPPSSSSSAEDLLLAVQTSLSYLSKHHASFTLETATMLLEVVAKVGENEEVKAQNLSPPPPSVIVAKAKTARKLAVVQESVDRALVRMADQHEQESASARAGYDVTAMNVLAWQVSAREALAMTFFTMLKLFAVVAMQSAVAALFVAIIVYSLDGLTVTDAAVARFGAGNYTEADLLSGDFEDEFADERSTRMQAGLTVAICLSWFFGMSSVVFFLGRIPMKWCFLLLPSLVFFGALPAVYYKLGGERVSPLFLLVGICIACGISTATIPDINFRFKRSHAVAEAGVAAHNRLAQQFGGEQKVVVKQKRSWRKRLKFGVFVALPVLMTLFMISLYAIGIFELNKLYEGSTAWMVAVSVFALVIKVVSTPPTLTPPPHPSFIKCSLPPPRTSHTSLCPAGREQGSAALDQFHEALQLYLGHHAFQLRDLDGPALPDSAAVDPEPARSATTQSFLGDRGDGNTRVLLQPLPQGGHESRRHGQAAAATLQEAGVHAGPRRLERYGGGVRFEHRRHAHSHLACSDGRVRLLGPGS